MSEEGPILSVRNLTKSFVRRGLLRSKEEKIIKAVDDISFDVYKGDVYGLIGESGCGKTTTARLIDRLIEPTSGDIIFSGRSIISMNQKELKELRRKVQFVFQDPYDCLSPTMTTHEIIAEPLRIHRITTDKTEEYKRVSKYLKYVSLEPPEAFMRKRPRHLSGGQMQRVAVARALILEPKLLLADEPLSMMDASVRISIANIMLDMITKLDLTVLFITHDIAMAYYMCNNVSVMYAGKNVEISPMKTLIKQPLHPYTQALISSVPSVSAKISRQEIMGEVPDPSHMPTGCRFHPRCSSAMDICKREEPKLVQISKKHFVACHLYSK